MTTNNRYLSAMKTIFFNLLLFCSIVVTTTKMTAQGFLRTYASERMHNFVENPDGGYLMIGTTTLTGFPQILLRRTDEKGFLLWEKEIPAPHTETAWDIVLATDNTGYILVGSTSMGSDFSNILSLKIDWNGDVIWRKSYGTLNSEFGSTIVAHEDNTYTILGTTTINEEGDELEMVQLLRINESGDSLWYRTYEYEAKHSNQHSLSNTLGAQIAYKQSLQTTSDHGIYFLGDNDNTLHIVEVDELGDIQEDIVVHGMSTVSEDTTLGVPNDWHHGLDFKTLEDGGFVLVGNRIARNWSFGQDTILNSSMIETAVRKLNEQGQIVWEKAYQSEVAPTTFTMVVYHKYSNSPLIEVADNGDLVFTSNAVYRDPTFSNISKSFLIRVNADGDLIWNKEYPIPLNFYQKTSLRKSANGHFVIGGFLHEEVDEEPQRAFLVKVDSNGEIHSNYINGRVSFDENSNCEMETEELGLKNWQVTLVGSDTIRTTTDSMGNYAFNVDTGNYALSVTPPNMLWAICDNNIPIQLQLSDTITTNFLAQANTNCTQLEVDIATPFLRRCFDNEYIISYRNQGTMTAENAYVEIDLDAALIYQEATLPFSQVQDNVYTFELGDIGVGEGGYFRLTAKVDCESTLGQTHCTEAHIFPDTICPPFEMEWDRASLQAAGICEGDSIIFTIRNVGEGDMEETLQYFVVEDELILMQAPFMLDAGADTSFVIYPEGATYRLEVEQSSDHPGFSSPSVTIEACGTGENGQISTGFVNLFSQDDHNHFIDIDCQENIGAFDPNDKQGFPKGYGNEHFITATTNLEYLIRFQNTGTDTAFTVVIRDELSPYLDIHSIRPGASSHLYDFKITGERTLEFSFEDIMLPDSNVNEAASHGFISFNIRQIPNNPNGTLIENTAGIYFDFNPPVITNTTKHTIGENFVEVATPVIHTATAPVSIRAYPNPFSERVTFDIKNSTANTFRFSLYDMAGQLLRRAHFADLSYEFWRGDLSGGLYFFRIEADGREVGHGKLVLSY